MKIFTPIISALFLFVYGSVVAQGSGKMLEFNGSSSYVNCGTINLSGSALTLMGWVKVDQFNTNTSQPGANIASLFGEENGVPTLMRFGDAGALAYDRLQFVIGIGRSAYKLNSTRALSTGKWYHIAGVYDGQTMKIYVDGVLDASQTQTGSITTNTTFQIGQNYNVARTFNGEMDEVSIWKAGLSQATIRNYMCKSVSSTHPNYSSLEAYWKMDQTTGTSLTDHSGNSHTGTLINSPTRQTSSAPIGDASVHNYGSPALIFMSHPNGDSLRATSISGAPTAVHMYRVDKKSNSSNFPASVSAVDTTRYWGIHYIGGTNPRANIAYYQTKNSFYGANSSCFIDLAKRANNSIANWSLSQASQTSTSLSLTSQNASEYILTFASNKSIYKDTAAAICIGDSIKLENSTSGFSYQWYKDGQVLTNDTMNAYKASQSGKYQLTLSFNGCVDSSNTVQLSVGQKPTVSLNAFNAICNTNGFDTLKGGMPGGGVFINPFVSGQLFVINSAGPGNHKIIYRYTSGNGCSDTASQILKVNPLPTVTLAPFTAVCEDSSAFNITTGFPSGGSYSVNGSAGASFDAKVLGNGSHTIAYTYTDGNSCSNTASQTIDVVALPIVTFRLPFLSRNVCEGSALFAINGSNPTGGIFSGTGVSGANFAPVSASVGTHSITYNYTDRTTGCKNSAKDTVNVNALPAAPTITQNGTELSATAADSYQWYDKDGKVFGETKQTYKPTRSGIYSVSITVGKCTSEISTEFDFDKTLSVSDIISKGYSIYPNPSEGKVTIEGESLKLVRLFDLSGKEVMQAEIANSVVTELSIEELISGAYIIEIQFDNGTSTREVLIRK